MSYLIIAVVSFAAGYAASHWQEDWMPVVSQWITKGWAKIARLMPPKD